MLIQTKGYSIIGEVMKTQEEMSYRFGFKHVTTKRVDATLKVMLKSMSI